MSKRLELVGNCGQIFVRGKYHQLSFHAPVGWEMNQPETRIGRKNVFRKTAVVKENSLDQNREKTLPEAQRTQKLTQ